MRRDWELVRQILLKLEDLSTTSSYLSPDGVPGYDPEIISYHMQLMDEAGLIKAKCLKTSGQGLRCNAISMTWEGHEFLDKIKNDSNWNKVKGIAREKGLDLSFDVIKLAAKTVLESLFG